MDDLESRIIELETKISYQDHIIQELNDVVTSQQKQMDQMEQQLKHFQEHLKGASALARPDEEVPPPHY